MDVACHMITRVFHVSWSIILIFKGVEFDDVLGRSSMAMPRGSRYLYRIALGPTVVELAICTNRGHRLIT